MTFRILPTPPHDLRLSIYEGDIFMFPPTAPSTNLAHAVNDMLTEAFGGRDVRTRAQALPNELLFCEVGKIRRTLYLDPAFQQHVRAVIGALGFDPDECAFDPLRLRVITSEGVTNPSAQAVYYPHRDTWYGHPQSIITWWIPLDDLTAEETFVFYPEHFDRPVPNDSEVFDYDQWVSRGWDLKIGWQDVEAGRAAKYPGALSPADQNLGLGFDCKLGQNLLFSGAHFHQTRPQWTGRTRFSLDFRIVHLPDDRSGLGAPNVDNRSRGSALPDYTHPL